jgi:hypothetical protein
MPKHFIYSEDLNKKQLFQGDILRRDEELISLLHSYHKHYAERENYRYFIVLTQSCDLVRRDSTQPSSPYITIAAVRPLGEAIRREAKKDQEWWQEPKNAISTKTREKLDLFTSSLLDNNVPNYFYLHEDISLKISGRNCAFLALSVAIKNEHYDLCLNAKIAQLNEEFGLKLGWLVGNMYSRVGTKEWDQHYGDGEAIKETKTILKDLFVNLPQDKIKQGVSELQCVKPLKQYSPDEIFDYIRNTKTVPKSTRFKDRAKEVLAEKYQNHPKKVRDKIVEELSQDAIIRKILS